MHLPICHTKFSSASNCLDGDVMTLNGMAFCHIYLQKCTIAFKLRFWPPQMVCATKATLPAISHTFPYKPHWVLLWHNVTMAITTNSYKKQTFTRRKTIRYFRCNTFWTFQTTCAINPIAMTKQPMQSSSSCLVSFFV